MTPIFYGNQCCRLDTFLSSSIGLFLTSGLTCPVSNPIGAALTSLGIYGIVTSMGVACIPKKIYSPKSLLTIGVGGLFSAILSAQIPDQLDPRIRVFSFFAMGIAPAIAVLRNIPSSPFLTTNLDHISVTPGG